MRTHCIAEHLGVPAVIRWARPVSGVAKANQCSLERVPRVKRIAGVLGVRAVQISAKAVSASRNCNMRCPNSPGVREDGMSGREW